MRRGLSWALLSLALLIPMVSGQATAQAPERQRAFVYGLNAAIPGNFIGSLSPPSARSLYLLAGQPSVISPRMTEIYYWPVTNEFQADWGALNEPVPGTIEVLTGGKVVKAVENTKYTIQYTAEGGRPTAKIYFGQEALDADARFRARQEAFRVASEKYYAAQRAWQAAVDAARAKGQTENLPPEPPPPGPIGIFSNGLNEGYPIDLPPGQYDLRLSGPDGKTVSDSERSLTVFTARRTAVGYSVVPETRWTTPEELNDPNDVILGKPGSKLYLEPRVTREYPARAWDLLENPQRPIGTVGEYKWVTGEPIRTGELEVLSGDAVIDRRSLTPYRVKQAPGASLGYEVLEFDPKVQGAQASPDFEAFPLSLGSARAAYRVRLVSAAGGRPLEGSERAVRVPPRASAGLSLLPAAPLALGAFLVTRRRLRMRLPRSKVS